jgi:hypothetical protein
MCFPKFVNGLGIGDPKMMTRKLKSVTRSALMVLPLLFASVASIAQDEPEGEQVLSQVLLGGKTPTGSAIIQPILEAEERPPAYEDFVPAGGAQSFRVAEFGEESINALDGNVLRKYAADGSEIIDDAFPVLCTNIFVEEIGKNGRPSIQSLDSCTSMLSLPDGSYRIFGADKGKKLVAYKYDPASAACTAVDPIEDRTCWGSVAIDGAPPQAAESVEDSGEYTLARTGADDAYWLIADKSKVYLAIQDAAPGGFDSLELVTRINGKNLTGLALLRDAVIVADDSGQLYKLTKDATGTWMTAEWTQAAFGPSSLCFPDGNKTEQKITMQSDGREDLLYIANQACGSVDILQQDGTKFLDTLYLSSSTTVSTPTASDADFFPSDIDVIDAIIGTWDACTTTNNGFCQIGQREGEAFVQNVSAVPPGGGLATFAGKKFVLQDCRQLDEGSPAYLSCPVSNCLIPSDKKTCDLDVIALALAADPTFADLLPDPQPVAVLPWWLRADLAIPPKDPVEVDPSDLTPEGLIDNQAIFFYYHIDTASAFENLATTTYDIDIIRTNLVPELLPNSGDEACPDPLQELSVAEVNEQTNMIAYLPDTYETVRCKFGNPSMCGLEKAATIMIESCVNPRNTPTFGFSGHVVGVESAVEEVDTFRDIASVQNAELQSFKEEILCNPDYEVVSGTTVGDILSDAILSPTDCGSIQSDLDQIDAKWAVCAAASNPSQGASAENCNALSTHISNLEATIASVSWPLLDPTDPDEFLILDRNARGEFIGRLRTFSYSVYNWWLASNAAPLVRIDNVDVSGANVTATALDLEDGNITASISWSVDSMIMGTGGTLSLTGLASGTYAITASVTDSDGLESSASTTVTIP